MCVSGVLILSTSSHKFVIIELSFLCSIFSDASRAFTAKIPTGNSSIPVVLHPNSEAANKVVPAPENGSNIALPSSWYFLI